MIFGWWKLMSIRGLLLTFVPNVLSRSIEFRRRRKRANERICFNQSWLIVTNKQSTRKASCYIASCDTLNSFASSKQANKATHIKLASCCCSLCGGQILAKSIELRQSAAGDRAIGFTWLAMCCVQHASISFHLFSRDTTTSTHWANWIAARARQASLSFQLSHMPPAPAPPTAHALT